MCGIAGYIGNKIASQVIIDMLHRLQYRGYDSAGIATFCAGQSYCIKRKGRVAQVQTASKNAPTHHTSGIGHTRWATHGQPNSQNSHPHFDCKQNFFVCHNGIIQNYTNLKNQLISRGHIFTSQTDSQVVPHLLQQYYQGNFQQAFFKTVSRLKGHFALVAKSKNHPDVILITAFKSPVILGITDNQSFVSSDIPGLLKYTKQIHCLQDTNYAILGKGQCIIKNNLGQKIEHKFQTCHYKVQQAQKEPYPHFMIKQIHQQPLAIQKALYAKDQIQDALQILKQSNRIVFVACGTSYYACLGAKTLLQRLGIPSQTVIGSQFTQACLNTIEKGNTIIAVSQSGETYDTKQSVQLAKKKSAKSICIVNVNSSSLTRMCDKKIYTYSGPQIGVASTKSYVGQMTVLCILAIRLASKRQKISKEYQTKLLDQIKSLPFKIKQLLNKEQQMKTLAQQIKDYRCFLFLGKRSSLTTAYQAALKLKELTYIHAQAFPAGQLKHGPLAILDNSVVVFAICDDIQLMGQFQNAIKECQAREAKVILVSPINCQVKLQHTWIKLSQCMSQVAGIISINCMHLLSYYMSIAKGLDPDKPRNLAKSITVR